MQRPLHDELEAWSRRNALVVCAAGTGVLAIGPHWAVSAAAAASFAHLLALARGRTTDRGDFGAGNLVTVLRLGAILALPAVPTRAFGAAMLAILALDGVDGFVARTTGTASEFGARFDMESDALFVMIVALQAWFRGQLGAWVLIVGALRYAYVVCLWVFPTDWGEEPRSEFGRFAFVALVVGLTAAWLTTRAWGSVAAALGCALVTCSFARSFLHSYGPR